MVLWQYNKRHFPISSAQIYLIIVSLSLLTVRRLMLAFQHDFQAFEVSASTLPKYKIRLMHVCHRNLETFSVVRLALMIYILNQSPFSAHSLLFGFQILEFCEQQTETTRAMKLDKNLLHARTHAHRQFTSPYARTSKRNLRYNFEQPSTVPLRLFVTSNPPHFKHPFFVFRNNAVEREKMQIDSLLKNSLKCCHSCNCVATVSISLYARDVGTKKAKTRIFGWRRCQMGWRHSDKNVGKANQIQRTTAKQFLPVWPVEY